MIEFFPELHIGQRIQCIISKRGMPKRHLAAKIGMTASTMTHLTTRKNVDVLLLHKVSNALQYNFFMDFQVDEGQGTEADKGKEIEALKAKIAELEKQNEEMKREADRIEIKYLRQTNELLSAALRPTLRLQTTQPRKKSLRSNERLMLEE